MKYRHFNQPGVAAKAIRFPTILTAAAIGLSLNAPVSAQTSFFAGLKGAFEVPTVSSSGVGLFTATVDDGDTVLSYSLFYRDLPTSVQQAHIHIGQAGANGGIVVFLCTNLGNGPAGTPACPEDSGTVQGSLTAADVVAVSAQGFDEGDFAEVLKAIREGNAYANVHTEAFPPGEIRGQIIAGP
ncbi:CHRD domain-containing protein [Methylohalobius crimeensis]|uniref:CHRD domain-containing protein n=1 Tax=Methylohalobius crimeensis TaxID=244365 RepID=UPI0003B33A6A|nr:CHRD domain-containing protein [Methylohalobius crimeensis]